MKNLCTAILAALTVVLLLVMVTEAAPVDDNQELLERLARSALDDPSIKRDALSDLVYEYLLNLQQQETEDPIYTKKSLSGLPGLDSMNMMSKVRNRHYKNLGRRRRSLSDWE